jgi:predicted transcriptional regulator
LDAAVASFRSADDHESSVEHLTELIDSGWVDATETGYEITDRGRIAADRLAAVVDAQRALATEGVTATEHENTIAVLEKVARNLGWND